MRSTGILLQRKVMKRKDNWKQPRRPKIQPLSHKSLILKHRDIEREMGKSRDAEAVLGYKFPIYISMLRSHKIYFL